MRANAAGMLYPIMLRRLFVTMGFPWAVRIMAFIILGCLAICCAVMRLRPRPRGANKSLIEFKHFRDKSYMAFVAGVYSFLSLSTISKSGLLAEMPFFLANLFM